MRAFVIMILLSVFSYSENVQEISVKQKEEWQKLYPKLNSKMARMEEILNAIERLNGDPDFTESLMQKALEFSYLAGASLKDIPDYLESEQLTSYKENLTKTEILGHKVYHAIDKGKDLDKLLAQLDEIRRKSHAKWAE